MVGDAIVIDMSKLEKEIAEALDGSPEILPYVVDLLAGLDELGGSAGTVLELLRPLGLPPGSRALDLGCGKGVVSVALARELGLDVLGVDAFAPFVAQSARRAEETGVSHLCRFRCGDLRDALRDEPPVDVLLMLAVGPVLGDIERTVGMLRTAVRPRGYMVIDDGYVADGTALPLSGYEAYAGHAETLRRLTVSGDVVLREHSPIREEDDRRNREMTEAIRRNAERLATGHPEVRDLLMAYVAEQECEVERIGRDIISAVWLLQRA